MSGTIDDMKAYTLLTDDVIYRILEMDDDSIKDTDSEDQKKDKEEKNDKISKSKDLIRRVLSRDLYKCMGEKRFPWGSFEGKVIIR